jgi:pimeloyl-ACP methyl ester carboxylesterase
MPHVIAEGGVALHYERHGSGVEDLLLLHGMGGSRTSWNAVLRHLDLSRFRVLTVDLRGHGQSTADPASFGFERFHRDLVTVIRAAGMNHVNVVGFSGGCKTAVWLAAETPALVRRVVLVAPPGLGIVPMPREVLWPFFEQLTREKSAPPVLEPWLTEKLGPFRDIVIRDYANTPLPVLKSAAEMWFYGSVEDQAARVRQRALVVAAAREPLGHADFQRETTLRCLPRAQLEMLDCGHWIPFEEPQALATLIMRFVETG